MRRPPRLVKSPTARMVLALCIIAPLCAEVIGSFNTPAFLFPVLLIVLGPLYGASGLLIREAWVRGRIGFFGAMLLGSAFAALDEGVFTAVWFDPKVPHLSTIVLGRAHGVN